MYYFLSLKAHVSWDKQSVWFLILVTNCTQVLQQLCIRIKKLFYDNIIAT